MHSNIHREEVAGELQLKVTGDFDGAAALDVKNLLDAVDGRPVVVDFSQVRHAQDLAVAVLARSLHANVRLKGLALHHERLLRYCGLAASLQQAAMEAALP